MGILAMPQFIQDSDKPYAARYVGSMVSVTWWNIFEVPMVFLKGLFMGFNQQNMGFNGI